MCFKSFCDCTALCSLWWADRARVLAYVFFSRRTAPAVVAAKSAWQEALTPNNDGLSERGSVLRRPTCC